MEGWTGEERRLVVISLGMGTGDRMLVCSPETFIPQLWGQPWSSSSGQSGS